MSYQAKQAIDRTEKRLKLLKYISISAKIDTIRFRADKAPDLPKRQFLPPSYGVFTLQDPTRKELELLSAYELVSQDVAVDFKPIKRVALRHREPLLQQTFFLLTETIYPWDGYGITPGAIRGVDGNGATGMNYSRPTWGQSLCFGHRENPKCNNLPDPAQFILYYKLSDQRDELRIEQRGIRAEVKFSDMGCQHHQLFNVGDLLKFDYRKCLAPYFRFIKPMLAGHSSDSKIYRRNPRLHSAVQKQKYCFLIENFAQSGAQSLLEFNLNKFNFAHTGEKAGINILNRGVGRALERTVKVRNRPG